MKQNSREMVSHFLLILSYLQLITATSNQRQSTTARCLQQESNALLEFKQSFSLSEHASRFISAYPRVLSWGTGSHAHGNTTAADCCLWDGVECDEKSGHVIALDLSSSMLYGSFNSSTASALFLLSHLRSLNLADNDFNYSHIPSSISSLSELRYLNLSCSMFSGQIPSEILELSILVDLDLSSSDEIESPGSMRTLRLGVPGLKDIFQKLTNLEFLNLKMVDISSTIPNTITNMSFLTSLSLRSCGLYGKVPPNIFLLPNLQLLSLRYNDNLVGYLPEFSQNSSLTRLLLSYTNLSGQLPQSIGNLYSLVQLDLTNCSFMGTLPPSLANLTQLNYLDLSYNHFVGEVPILGSLSKLTLFSLQVNQLKVKSSTWVGMLSSLNYLALAECNLNGEIPTSFANLTQLNILLLPENNLIGAIPSWIANITHMRVIELSENRLKGSIPTSLFQLRDLQMVGFSINNLVGTVVFDEFLNLKNLRSLGLGNNKLSILFNNTTNSTIPKFVHLDLSGCGLKEFPDFLRFQDELQILNLWSNNIQGLVPHWFQNISAETLVSLGLAFNSITGFEQNPVVLPWTQLRILELTSNVLQGSLPIPWNSVLVYSVRNNMLTGTIPPLICSSSSINTLDLSSNRMSGVIPPCLGNFSHSLSVLNLSNNNFHGIPQLFIDPRSNLKLLDLSRNQIQGGIPKSLANCRMLEILDLGNNLINDTFPDWLGGLAELQVLVLKANKFHGSIGRTENGTKFPKLRIVDLCHNRFKGDLPIEYLSNSKAMKLAKPAKLVYMMTNTIFQHGRTNYEESYVYSITIANKGKELLYEKLSNIFVALDLSANRFEGYIPRSIGDFVGLQALNLSNNNLVGFIPRSIGNLKNLESLDLSQNALSGRIPQQLTQLDSLAVLNLSYNDLSGPIPIGRHFDTFSSDSFKGNKRLCGVTLLIKCERSQPIQFARRKNESKLLEKFDWLIIMMGYGCGLVVGILMGYILISRYNVWFDEKFSTRHRQQRKKQVQKRPARL